MLSTWKWRVGMTISFILCLHCHLIRKYKIVSNYYFTTEFHLSIKPLLFSNKKTLKIYLFFKMKIKKLF